MNISTNNLSIGYPSRVVQSSLSFSLHQGELVALLGPNGCGKTTLLRTLASLLPPLAGAVSPQLNATNLALVLTEPLTLPATSVFDVVALGRYPYTSFLGTLTAEDQHIIASSLQAVGLTSHPLTPFSSLSSGDQQRVLIAKALAQQTSLILLDEPTSHLDLPNRLRIFRLLRTLAEQQHKTILISTHELDLALAFSHRALLMSQQGIQLIESPKNAKTDPEIRSALSAAYAMDISAYL